MPPDPFPFVVQPMLPTLSRTPFLNSDWLFEPKWLTVSKSFRVRGSYTAAAALVLSLLCLSCSLFQRYEVTATIPVGGQGNSVVIQADTYYDNGRKLFYQVKNGEKVLVDRSFICSQLNEGVGHSGFKIVTARSGNLVGIFQESRPEYILLLHDFTSSQTWPGVLSASESHVETRNRGNALLASLQLEHPNLKLKLNELECD